MKRRRVVLALCLTAVLSVLADGIGLVKAEYTRYHREITGREPAANAVRFRLDPAVAKRGNDAYAIVSDGAGAVITGANVRSLFYGLYDLLERRGGCRWFWDVDVVPRKEAIDLTGLDVREEARFAYRGIRYFAHRGLTRFQAEHWGPEDWKREIDWCLKRRLNVFMLRIGQDDLFQRAFPEDCAYPDASKDLPGAGRGYDNRTLFWSLEYRGKLRHDLQQYAFARGLMVPEDFGTMTHWYSRTPEDFLAKRDPPFLPQATKGYSERNGLVWDIRDPKWVDAYWKLTTTACDAYGQGKDQQLLHTIGLGERRCFTNRQDNLNLKIHALRQFLDRAHRDYPNARNLLAGWDFYFTWRPEEVRELVKSLDPTRDIIWDYEGDTTRDYRPEMKDLGGNNFTKWGVVGRFPYTFSVFLAFENALDIRANYPLIEQRQKIVQNDPACAGYIFWPESSHTDTLLLRFFTANAWSAEPVPHGKVLAEFCASRYGAQAARMKALWEKVVPLSYMHDWSNNYGYLFTRAAFGTKQYGAAGKADAQKWGAQLAAAKGVFAGLAAVDWQGEAIRRDSVDLARTVLDRMISIEAGTLVADFEKWQGGAENGKGIAAAAERLAMLADRMADLLELHTDYSLWESYRRLEAIEPVRNPAFPAVLFDNAANNYCQSHQYELARHWYAPRAHRWAKEIAARVAAGDRQRPLRIESGDALREALRKRPLESLAPRAERTPKAFADLMTTLAACAGATPGAEMSVVRVRQTPTGPKIFENGTPINPRVCYTRSIMSRIPVGLDWKHVSYKTTSHRTMNVQYRVKGSARQPDAGLEIRNFRIVDDASGKALKGDLPPFAPQKDGQLTQISCSTPTMGPLVKGRTYTISFDVRANAETFIWPGLYQTPGHSDVYTYPIVQVPPDDFTLTSGYKEAIEARKVGIRLFTPYFPCCFLAEDDPDFGDFAPFDAEVDALLKAVPDALFFPRINSNAIAWWYRKHPEAKIVLQDGKSLEFPSVSSRAFRRDAAAYITACVKHLAEKYPRNYAGIQIGGQACNEWVLMDGYASGAGYCGASRDAYAKWRAAKGLPPHEPPTHEERRAAQPGGRHFYDPATTAYVAEFNDFLRRELADCLGGLAKVAYEATDGRKMVISFYSYAWEHARNFRGPGITGTSGLEYLLANYGRYFDVLAAPIGYSDRGWLGTCPVIGTVETIKRHGILWMNEDDFRTPDATNEGKLFDPAKDRGTDREGVFGYVWDYGRMDDTLLRSSVSEAIRGLGEWWMDLGGTGWFESPRYWKTLADIRELDERMLSRATAYEPEVALTIDEDSLLWLASGKDSRCSIHQARKDVPRAGVTLGQYLYHDALDNPPPKAKLMIHFASYLDDPVYAAKAARLRTARPDMSDVWCWAPGYVGKKGYDVRGVKALTGFEVTERALTNAVIRATEKGLAAGLPKTLGFSESSPSLAVVTEPGDEVWGTWADGTPAIVIRPRAAGRGYTAFLGQAPYEDPATYRALADRAGVHAYFPREQVGKAVVFATEGLACVQSFENATFDFLKPDGSKVPLDIRKGEVRILGDKR